MPLEEDTTAEARQEMGRAMMKKMVHNAVLLVLVTSYVIGGAHLFINLEYDGYEEGLMNTVETSKAIEEQKNKLADDLWFHKQQDDYDDLVEELIEEYHKNVTDAINDAGYPGKIVERSEMSNSWGFASALLFTITVVTTIGYGHVSPTTEVGQAVLIAYALIGIPLMLMFLANIDNGCCRCCNRRRDREFTDMLREQELAKLGNKQVGGKKSKVGGISARSPRDSAWDDDDGGSVNDNITTQVEDIEVDDEDHELANVPISLVLCIIAVYVLIGSVLFGYWNNWSGIKGAYFSFVTLSTIGFGDLVPGWEDIGTTEGMIKLILANGYIVVGLAVLSMAFNLMMEEMINKFKWLGQKIGVVDDGKDPEPEIPENLMNKDTEQLVND